MSPPTPVCIRAAGAAQVREQAPPARPLQPLQNAQKQLTSVCDSDTIKHAICVAFVENGHESIQNSLPRTIKSLICRSRLAWSRAHDWKSCRRQKRLEGSNPSFSATSEQGSLCSDLFLSATENKPSACFPTPSFYKKSRSAHLLGCKHPCGGSLSPPAFASLRGLKSHHRNSENIFFMRLSQKRSVILMQWVSKRWLFFK